MHIFISYAHDDTWQVEEVVKILSASGHDCWFDVRLTVGKDWKEQLREAIESCDSFLYALTPESVTSDWCLWEFATAVELKKNIIPVLLQAKTQIPEPIIFFQYADLSQGITPFSVAKLLGGLTEIAVNLNNKDLDIPSVDPKGTPAQAIEASKIAPNIYISKNSNSPEAKVLTDLGKDLHHLGKLEESLAKLEKAITIDPLYPDAYVARGSVFRDLGDRERQESNNEKAREYYLRSTVDATKCIELDPPSVWVSFLNRGHANWLLGNYESSLADYTKSIIHNPSYTHAYINRARLFAFLGRDTDRLKDLKKVLELEPNNIEAYEEIADACFLLHMFDDALKYYEEYLARVKTPKIEIQQRVDLLKDR